MVSNSKDISTLASVIDTAIENRLKSLHTHMPGIIQSFDPETQLATVQPAIKRVFKIEDDEGVEILTPTDFPLCINVKVIFPRSGGFTQTTPVKEGDECLLLFCERAIDTWYNTGVIRQPSAKRFHSLSDAVAMLGLSSLPNKIENFDNENMILKKDDESIVVKLKDNGDLEITSNANVIVNAATSVTIESPDINLVGNVVITGNLDVQGDTTLTSNVTSNGKDIGEGHSHAGSPTAPNGPVSDTGAVT